MGNIIVCLYSQIKDRPDLRWNVCASDPLVDSVHVQMHSVFVVHQDTHTVTNQQTVDVWSVSVHYSATVLVDAVTGDEPGFSLHLKVTDRKMDVVWREATEAQSEAGGPAGCEMRD